jgi:uncharacterized membrane protein YdjX (TVP38/TMEM64 family)
MDADRRSHLRVTLMPQAESGITVWAPAVVSVIAMLVFVVALAVAWVTHDPSLGILLGVAATNAGTVCGYWLGSSSGSRAKDKTIADQTRVKQP